MRLFPLVDKDVEYMTKGNAHHTTQYAVRLRDGSITPPAPTLDYCEQQLEIAAELAKTDPTYENVEIVSRVITTTRTEWEPYVAAEAEEADGRSPVLAEDRAPKKRGRPRKAPEA